MADLQKVRQNRIEKKYSKLIAKTIDRMKDCKMSELWVELDKLKSQMALDFEKAGIKLSES